MQKLKYIRFILAFALVFTLIVPLFGVNTEAATREEVSDFLATICPMATQNMKDTGILASLTIAQAIYESGWGTSTLAKSCYNIFGIKAYAPAWTGKVFCRKTKTIYSNFTEAEKIIGEDLFASYKEDFFRVYTSWAESLKDHSDLFLKFDRYKNLRGETDYKKACNYVMQDGYCDDSGYADYLIRLIENYELYKWDVASGVVSVDMGVSKLVMLPGEKLTVYPAVENTDSSKVYLSYSSSNTSVATVDDDGIITAVSEGVSQITVSATNGKSDSAMVYVHKSTTKLTSAVTISGVNCRSEASSKQGSATVLGTFASNTDVVIFGSSVNSGWYMCAGFGYSGKLLYGYTYKDYLKIGEEITGDTPVEPEEETSEESMEEASQDESTIIRTDLKISEILGTLNCRSGSDNSYSAVGSFAAGTKVLAVGNLENSRWQYCVGIGENGKVTEGYCGHHTSDGKTTYIKTLGYFTASAFELTEKDGTIYGIPEGCTVSKLSKAMTYAGVKVLDKSGKTLGNSEIIKNGYTVCFLWCEKVYVTLTAYIETKEVENVMESSLVLTEDTGYIYGIPSSYKVSDLAGSMKYASVEAYDCNGNAISSGSLISNGSKIRFIYNGSVYKEITAVISGDINCDGIVDASDYISLRLAILGAEELNDVQNKAASIKSGESADISDYIRLRLAILGCTTE